MSMSYSNSDVVRILEIFGFYKKKEDLFDVASYPQPIKIDIAYKYEKNPEFCDKFIQELKKYLDGTDNKWLRFPRAITNLILG